MWMASAQGTAPSDFPSFQQVICHINELDDIGACYIYIYITRACYARGAETCPASHFFVVVGTLSLLFAKHLPPLEQGVSAALRMRVC